MCTATAKCIQSRAEFFMKKKWKIKLNNLNKLNISGWWQGRKGGRRTLLSNILCYLGLAASNRSISRGFYPTAHLRFSPHAHRNTSVPSSSADDDDRPASFKAEFWETCKANAVEKFKNRFRFCRVVKAGWGEVIESGIAKQLNIKLHLRAFGSSWCSFSSAGGLKLQRAVESTLYTHSPQGRVGVPWMKTPPSPYHHLVEDGGLLTSKKSESLSSSGQTLVKRLHCKAVWPCLWLLALYSDRF